MSIDPCTITKTAQAQMNALGVDTASLQKKLDNFALQANKSFDFLNVPIVRDLVQNFNNALSTTVTGTVGTISSALAAKIGQNVNIVSAILGLVLTFASAGTQVQALLVSQLKREVSIRLMIFRMLLWHYQDILRVLYLLNNPTSVSYAKILAVLPYVKRAEVLFKKVVLAQGTGNLPARYSYPALQSAFSNLQTAVFILTSNYGAGGQPVASALESQFGGTKKQKVNSLAQKLAADLVFSSIAKSLSYVEELTWNFTNIASMLPVPYEAGNTIFKPANILDSFLKANGATTAGATPFNANEAQGQRTLIEDNYLNQANKNLANIIADIDVQKGLIPTTVLIDSLINSIINFPALNLDLQGATADLLTFLMPVAEQVSTIRQDMQQAIAEQDADLVLTGKEAVWTMTLNALLALKDGALGTFGGQATIIQDKYSLEDLIAYLTEVRGSFIIAETMPKFVLQSLSVLGAPFSARSLQESQVLSTFLIKQLKIAINQDQQLLFRCLRISEPLTQFSQLLAVASKMPEPVSTIAKAMMTGQVTEVVGFVTSITLGTIDSIKKLFGSNCPEVNSPVDHNLEEFDALYDEIDTFYGKGTGQQNTTGIT